MKVLTARIGDDEARRAFERECRAMGTLSGHPHIVAVHRGGTTASGEPFIVMVFMSGGSLADRMARSGPLPWSEVLDIGVLVAGALETAHRALLQAAQQRAACRPVTRPVIEGERTAHLPKAALAAAETSVVTPSATPSATTVAQPGPSDLPASWPPAAPAHNPPGVPPRLDALPPWPPPRPAPSVPHRGWLIGGVAVALVAVVGLVTTFVLLGRTSPPEPVGPTAAPTPSAIATTPVPPPTTAPAGAVAIDPGITHPATTDVARVLDTYVTGINERRYSDAFALLTPDNPTAKKGIQPWIDAESTTRIRDARLLSVSDGPAGAGSTRR